MKRLIAAGFSAIVAGAVFSSDAQAQGRPRAQTTQMQAQPEQKCLRAFDGSCTNADMVEAARLRAVIVPSVRVSYYGTPAGTIGGNYIPFERLFRDNAVLFGLPVSTFACCNVIQRTQ
ncbi:MAG TPA: hypothetical protein VJL90_01305 [Pseudorhodoplanes sp.]|nr:hypothetical protein [Pseudorhodoplanes sp.]